MRPPCHNRPPFARGRTVYGIDQQTGSEVVVRLSNAWFTDRCATWDGVGIGPNNERYPVARGFDCRGCRWLPERFNEGEQK